MQRLCSRLGAVRAPNTTANGRKRYKRLKPRRHPVRRIDSPISSDEIVHGTGSKRGRSSSPEDEDGHQPKRSHTEPSQTSDAILQKAVSSSKGRIMGRMVCMWGSFRTIIEEGSVRDPGEDVSHVRTDEQNDQYDLFNLMVLVAPGLIPLFEHLDEEDIPGVIAELGESIDNSRNDARRDDANKVKDSFEKWPTIHWGDENAPKGRDGLGFKNDTTGRLLVPPSEDWGNTQTRADYRSGKKVLRADNYPSFLWPEGGYDMDDLSQNMFRGEVLVSAYTHIFIGPKAAKGEPKSSRRGNANLHDISFVTFPSLCYTATILRYALSDVSVFSSGSPNDKRDFPHKTFYDALIFSSNYFLEDELDNLLDWWNKQIFPLASSGFEPAPDTVASKMEEQVKEKRKNRENARCSESD